LTEPTPISQVPERNEPTLPPLPKKPKVEFYNREVQTSTYETVPARPTEEEIRQRIQAEVEAARVARERELEEENNQMAKEIEDEIRGMWLLL
jgi:dynein cytoplasmic 1 intermediate chain